MREFRAIWREEEGVEALEFGGSIDSRTAQLFGAIMETMTRAGGGDLRLYFGELQFMSSASVGQLVMLVNDRRARGRRVELRELPEHLAALLKRMRLDAFLGGPSKGL